VKKRGLSMSNFIRTGDLSYRRSVGASGVKSRIGKLIPDTVLTGRSGLPALCSGRSTQ